MVVIYKLVSNDSIYLILDGTSTVSGIFPYLVLSHILICEGEALYSQHFSDLVLALFPCVGTVQTRSFKTCTGRFQDLYCFLIKKKKALV